KYVVSGFSRTVGGPPEGGHYIQMKNGLGDTDVVQAFRPAVPAGFNTRRGQTDSVFEKYVVAGRPEGLHDIGAISNLRLGSVRLRQEGGGQPADATFLQGSERAPPSGRDDPRGAGRLSPRHARAPPPPARGARRQRLVRFEHRTRRAAGTVPTARTTSPEAATATRYRTLRPVPDGTGRERAPIRRCRVAPRSGSAGDRRQPVRSPIRFRRPQSPAAGTCTRSRFGCWSGPPGRPPEPARRENLSALSTPRALRQTGVTTPHGPLRG